MGFWNILENTRQLEFSAVTSMGASGSIEQKQPARGGPSHEPPPPDDEQKRACRAALKNTDHKQGDLRQLKAAALGKHSTPCSRHYAVSMTTLQC